MRAKVSAVAIDAADRTVDLTVEISSDAGVLLETRNDVILPIDGLTRAKVVRRLKGLIKETKIKQTAVPLTQAQAEQIAKNVVAIEPD